MADCQEKFGGSRLTQHFTATATQALSGYGLQGFALKQALPALYVCIVHARQDEMQSDLTVSLQKPICAHLNFLNKACRVLCKWRAWCHIRKIIA